MLEIKDASPSEVLEETKPTEKPVENNPLFDTLSSYKEAPVSTPTNVPLGSSTQTSQSPVDVPRYKTGPKAGQPRPPRKVRIGYNQTNEISSISGEILTGALFLTLIDLVMPVLIIGLNNRFSDQKMNAKDLKLSDKQKAELAPIADKVVKQLNINANPNMLLIVSMFGIYAANFVALKLTLTAKQNEKSNSTNAKEQDRSNGFTHPTANLS